LNNYLNKKNLLFAVKQLSKNDSDLSALFATEGVPHFGQEDQDLQL